MLIQQNHRVVKKQLLLLQPNKDSCKLIFKIKETIQCSQLVCITGRQISIDETFSFIPANIYIGFLNAKLSDRFWIEEVHKNYYRVTHDVYKRIGASYLYMGTN